MNKRYMSQHSVLTILRTILPHPRQVLHRIVRHARNAIIVQLSNSYQERVERRLDSRTPDDPVFDRVLRVVLRLEKVAKGEQGGGKAVVLSMSSTDSCWRTY